RRCRNGRTLGAMAAARWGVVAVAGLGAIALVLAAPSPAPKTASAVPAAFSRARWIAAAQHSARFDGGLEQSDARTARRLRALRAQALPVPPKQHHPRPTPDGPPNVRISEDILAPDPTSNAQPETEAEPSLTADLADERHLVAGYQEDRFEDGGARALAFAASFDLEASWLEGLLPPLTR